MTAPAAAATWKRTSIHVERVYEITDVADLQDGSTTRRMVIRPRKVTLYQIYGTNLVRSACIEGRQVRADSVLAGSKVIRAGISRRWRDTTPPPWLNDILHAEGLTLATDEQVDAHR